MQLLDMRTQTLFIFKVYGLLVVYVTPHSLMPCCLLEGEKNCQGACLLQYSG